MSSEEYVIICPPTKEDHWRVSVYLRYLVSLCEPDQSSCQPDVFLQRFLPAPLLQPGSCVVTRCTRKKDMVARGPSRSRWESRRGLVWLLEAWQAGGVTGQQVALPGQSTWKKWSIVVGNSD